MSTVDQQTQAQPNGASISTIRVDNPATGATVGQIPNLDRDGVGELVARARAIQPSWEALGYDGRGAIMLEMRAWMSRNRERIIHTVCEENGKTWEDVLLAELLYNLDALGFWARKAPKYLADEKVRPHSPFLFANRLIERYRPFGVVGVIGPWNYPLVNTFGDAIPALMAGNTVVLKPSSLTPLTSLLIAEGLRESGMPEDVLLVATGSGDTGSAVVDFADFVHFTGSTEVGKKVMARAAETLTPVSLELGGKDPMIVCADADIERAANSALFYSMQNGGQTCISVERVYVEEPIYEDFVSRVAAKARKLRQGVPRGPGSVEVGAVTYPEQAELIERHVRDAVEKGAKVLVGGARNDADGGIFFQPTVLRDVDHSMEIMTEETFGPTLPIMRVRDADEAVRLANASRYGLDSSVFTSDLEKGERLARRVQAGATCVNDCSSNYFALEVPFGGMKESGMGARHGPKGIQKYCQTQQIMVKRLAPKREIYFFPYRRRVTKGLGRALALVYGRGLRRT